MNTFERDRNLIVALSDQDARNVLEMLDNGITYAEAPSAFRAALAAAQRCPDVARFFLVEKTHNLTAARTNPEKNHELRNARRPDF